MVKIIFIILLIILGATFCAMNRQEVFLRYFFGWSTESFPLYLLILTSLMAGIVVGFSVGWGERWKLRAKARELGKRVKALKDDIETPTPREESPETEEKAQESGTSPLSKG